MWAHLSTPPNLVAKSCFLFSATIFGECGVGANGKEFWIQKHECVEYFYLMPMLTTQTFSGVQLKPGTRKASQGLEDTLISNYKNSSTNKKELLCEL